MRVSHFRRSLMLATCLLLFGSFVLPGVSQAKTAQEIDASVNAALVRFDQQVTGGAQFLATAKGVLVFPDVIKAALVFGGQYGEGALRVGGVTRGYYSTTGGSLGASIGVEKKDIVFQAVTDLRIRLTDAGKNDFLSNTPGQQRPIQFAAAGHVEQGAR